MSKEYSKVVERGLKFAYYYRGFRSADWEEHQVNRGLKTKSESLDRNELDRGGDYW